MKYVALCCIAKDEDPFLKEWLAYHALIGFEHFFVYDNNSARPIANALDGFAGADRLTVLRSDEERSQIIAYTHCLATFGHAFKWIAFLDLDEFIRISPDNGSFRDVRELLAVYEPYAGLGLNWRMFSSAGHEQRPAGLVIEQYTRYYEDDFHIKSIVQPDKTNACAGPHSFYPYPGHYAVNAEHFPIPGGFPACLPAMKEACVNHYFFKSRECFQEKIARGNPCGIARRMEDFDRHLALPTKNDSALIPFAENVRGALAANRLPLPEELEGKAAPVHAPETAGQETSDAELLLAAAREHVKRDGLLQASLCLCYASLLNDAGQDVAHGKESADAKDAAGPGPAHSWGARPSGDGKDACAGKRPDPLLSLEIWTLRASIAGKCGRHDRAEFFLRQAFAHGASVRAHSELANVMLNTGRVEESRRLVALIRAFNTLD